MLSAMQCWNATYGLSTRLRVENDYAIVIAMLSDWLKTLPDFQPIRSKAKTNLTLYALWAIQLEVIARNSGSSRCLLLCSCCDWSE